MQVLNQHDHCRATKWLSLGRYSKNIWELIESYSHTSPNFSHLCTVGRKPSVEEYMTAQTFPVNHFPSWYRQNVFMLDIQLKQMRAVSLFQAQKKPDMLKGFFPLRTASALTVEVIFKHWFKMHYSPAIVQHKVITT